MNPSDTTGPESIDEQDETYEYCCGMQGDTCPHCPCFH